MQTSITSKRNSITCAKARPKLIARTNYSTRANIVINDTYKKDPTNWNIKSNYILLMDLYGSLAFYSSYKLFMALMITNIVKITVS